jgi:hypothetical protein
MLRPRWNSYIKHGCFSFYRIRNNSRRGEHRIKWTNRYNYCRAGREVGVGRTIGHCSGNSFWQVSGWYWYRTTLRTQLFVHRLRYLRAVVRYKLYSLQCNNAFHVLQCAVFDQTAKLRASESRPDWLGRVKWWTRCITSIVLYTSSTTH